MELDTRGAGTLGEIQPIQHEAPSLTFVCFVDLMGFAELLNALPDFVVSEDLQKALALSDTDNFDRAPVLDPNLQRLVIICQKLRALVTKAYAHAKVIATYVNAETSLLQFSDCLYFSSSVPVVVHAFTRMLMHDAYYRLLPLRGGIGAGSFAISRLVHQFDPRKHTRADIGFVGTAVVRAYRAERAGLKGLRIWIDDSAKTGLACWALALPQAERTSSISTELNLLREYAMSDRCGYNGLVYWLETMRQQAPESALEHYVATKDALDRMLKARGFEP